MAMNITFPDLRQVVIPQILALLKPHQTQKEAQKVYLRWFPILAKFTHSDEDQIDCLNLVVQFLIKHPVSIPRTPFIIKCLYDVDVVEEDMIIKWYEGLEDAAGPLMTIRDAATSLVDWLQEAESEDESE